MSRIYTSKLLEMIEEGLLNKDNVIMACVKYMSEDDVKDMMECNEFVDYMNEDEEEDLEETKEEQLRRRERGY